MTSTARIARGSEKPGGANGRRRRFEQSLKFRTRWRHVLAIAKAIRSGTWPNCSALAAELELNRRTILRDIEFLKFDLGAPIEYDAERRGYYYSQPHWSMPNVQISQGELLAVLVAEKALQAHGAQPWAEGLRRVLDRMLISLPQRIDVRPAELLGRLDFDTDAPSRVEPEVLTTVSQAVTASEVLRMSYCKLGEGRPQDYVVDPYMLRRVRGAWYLAAKDHRTGYVPLFNLSRVAGVQTTGIHFDYEAGDFDPKEYFGDTFRAYRGTQRHKVVLEFSKYAAQLVRERQWHGSQKLTDLPDGGVRLEVIASHLDDVWPWAMSWGSDARVIGPPELVRIMADEAQKLGAMYKADAVPQTSAKARKRK